MSIAAQETPNEGVKYLLSRLISDLVGTLGPCAPSATDLAVDAGYDCLGSVYPLIGNKGNSQELLGTTVSIGGGYCLAARHSIYGHRQPFTSNGIKTFPGLGIGIDNNKGLHQTSVLELTIVSDDIAEGVDLVLLRVTCIDDCQKLKSARLPVFESTNVSSELSSLISNFGLGALFVGYGAMTQAGISEDLKKNDIATFICNQDLAEQTIAQLISKGTDTTGIERGKSTAREYQHIFLSMGSSQRYPYWNDSGGGLFVFYEGKVYLVGLHYKAIKYGHRQPVTYPLFINLLRTGSDIQKSIQRDRPVFLSRPEC